MIIRNSTSCGDFTFGKGLSDYLKDSRAIAHNLKTRLLSWKEDCFFATAEGVDYNNLLDVGTKNILDSDIKRVTLQSEGVIKINAFSSSLNVDDRAYTATITYTDIFKVSTITI